MDYKEIEPTQVRDLMLDDDVALVDALRESLNSINKKLDDKDYNPNMSMLDYSNIIATIIERFGGKVKSPNCYILINVSEDNLSIANQNLDIEILKNSKPLITFDMFEENPESISITSISDLNHTYSSAGIKLIKITDGLTHTPIYSVKSTILSQTTSMLRNSLNTVLIDNNGNKTIEKSYGVLNFNDLVTQRYQPATQYFQRWVGTDLVQISAFEFSDITCLTSDVKFICSSDNGEYEALFPFQVSSDEIVDSCLSLWISDNHKYMKHPTRTTEDGRPEFFIPIQLGVETGPKVSFGFSIASVSSILIDDFQISNVTNAIVQSNIASVGRGAFANFTGISSIVFNQPSYVTAINDYAFYNCSSLLSIEIPEGVSYIAPTAFKGCSNLRKVIFPSTLDCSLAGLLDAYINVEFHENTYGLIQKDNEFVITNATNNEISQLDALNKFAELYNINKYSSSNSSLMQSKNKMLKTYNEEEALKGWDDLLAELSTESSQKVQKIDENKPYPCNHVWTSMDPDVYEEVKDEAIQIELPVVETFYDKQLSEEIVYHSLGDTFATYVKKTFQHMKVTKKQCVVRHNVKLIKRRKDICKKCYEILELDPVIDTSYFDDAELEPSEQIEETPIGEPFTIEKSLGSLRPTTTDEVSDWLESKHSDFESSELYKKAKELQKEIDENREYYETLSKNNN